MTESPHSFFAASRLTLILTLIVLFGFGLGIRLYDLTNPPLDFHPTRQLLSALKARGMYDQTAPGVPGWQRRMALQQWKVRAEVEPEVFEHLVAFTYRFTGVQLWVARVYSSLFWIIGGIFLFLLARDLVSVDAAVLATGYYLFFPYAVIASRSFQPDPMMVMLMLGFWWTVTRWARLASEASSKSGHTLWFWAILAGLFGGFAIFIKFVAAFFVIGAALGALLWRFPVRDLIRKPQAWLMVVLGAFPGAAYLFYGIVLQGFLGRQFGGRFIPALLISPLNYVQWATMANMAAGGLAIVFGLLGLFLVREKSNRAFLLGLWSSYFVFGAFFDYHVATHDYYHLPLIPLVAISLSPLAGRSMNLLVEMTTTRLARIAAAFVLLYGLLAAVWGVRNQMKSMDYRPQIAMWSEIGDVLNHGPNILALTQDYGTRLAYWGWQNAQIWPNSGDIDYHEERGASFQTDKLFTRQAKNASFFLVTDFAELDRQPALKVMLERYPIYAQADGYIIYDLRALPGN